MKRPSTGLVLGSLLVLAVVVTLGVLALRGDTPAGVPDQASGDVPGDTLDEPTPVGASLERLSSPPERSLWALSPDGYEAGVEISVEFEPYGYGPSSYGPSVVVRVVSTEPPDSAAEIPDLAGRNVVFLLGDSVVDKGGRYTGTAVTREQDDRVVLVLKDVRPLP